MDCLSKLGKVELGYKPRLSASTDLNLRKAFMYIKRRFLQLLQGERDFNTVSEIEINGTENG